MSLPTPRLLPEHLHAFLPGPNISGPSTIRILGTVTALRGEHATINCGNHGDVTLILNREAHLQLGRMVDVVGKVTQLDGGLAVRVLNAVDCGDPKEIDYKIYEQVVEVTHRVKEIFY
ncbi:ssDNA binding protein Ssb3 [Histoplasma capsulatum var. duboisii H88]|uniref:SsDNA binding protein Ssb3 n=4 Tax=Ajellomyces capsulatus TaxID=5037 RepID=C0NFG6_AJECG|nr:uncharacterized protein HCBG_01632 [Histoplasma capsulatum G186AR]EER38826.1 ssDNA binding protein Ssb3 [Histoplasma capsulatum H143]EGC44457.1 ssDNA binding protein Ssb3 [Histoplasma capsulatum var. duboisii H88]KAG5291069.1 ssDNA binding protein Ssb3 [Histoplasma capsulatum]EEH09987.1 conserved hypothetical protein [Histoplasma capsulatum G186AR]QSS55231.1 ssDNA binding protein Ssb3 [Histoplasma capsulatum var. duboisii H88]